MKSVLDLPSHHARRIHAQGRATRTQGVPAPEDFQSHTERLIEIEFSRRDRLRGHRHEVSELFPTPDGQPTRAGRQPWTPSQA